MTQNEILEIAKEVYGETVWTEASLARLQQFVNLIVAKYEQKIQDLEDLITELQERQA